MQGIKVNKGIWENPLELLRTEEMSFIAGAFQMIAPKWGYQRGVCLAEEASAVIINDENRELTLGKHFQIELEWVQTFVSLNFPDSLLLKPKGRLLFSSRWGRKLLCTCAFKVPILGVALAVYLSNCQFVVFAFLATLVAVVSSPLSKWEILKGSLEISQTPCSQIISN